MLALENKTRFPSVILCLSYVAFSPHCKLAGSATENCDKHIFSEHDTRYQSHVIERSNTYQSVAKRSPNSFSDATSSAVLPASIASTLIDVIYLSLINFETLKYFNNSQLKLLTFQTPLSRTFWTDVNNGLVKLYYLKPFYHYNSVCFYGF